MTLQIEQLQHGEGERFRRIRLRALREAPHAFGTTHAEASSWSADRWEAQVAAFATFVAVVDGSDVGVARCAAHSRRDVRELISMWVAPEARRQRIGSALIERVAAWATRAGATALLLDVVVHNASAIALYERAGFVRMEGASMEAPPGEIRLVRTLATTSQ